MQTNDIKLLDSLIEKKIQQLNRYNEVTCKIVHEDIEGASELISKRQEIIQEVDGISLEIRELVSRQSTSKQAELKSILSFKDVSFQMQEGLKAVHSKTLELKDLLLSIEKEDKKVKSHLDKLKVELDRQMQRSNNEKKVIDYMNSMPFDIFKGKTLNSKT